jgi:CCR4-NOT transcription complex subunit 1
LSYPGFALAWLDLISCKYFVSPFLEYGLTQKNNRDIIIYEKYLYLVIDLFNFPKYYANEIMVDFSSEIFLKNLYKFIYVLYKSYPEFISNYYYIIIVSLPSGNHFIELKNLILSCGPKEIEKPDPFSDEIDSILPEKKKNASILFDIASILKDYGFKDLITQFIETKNINVVSELCKKLNAHKNRNFNFYVINAIVIYFAQKILRQLQEKKNKKNEIFDFFMKMMEQLESDNRDHLINSILNELRYVSTQTLFFKNLIIYILSEIKNDNIEEQIIGNIFQRLIFKPIPWGLTLTFAQLIKNNKYKLAEKTYFKKANLDESFIKKVKDFIQNESSGNFINS